MLGTTKIPRHVSSFLWPAGVLIAGGAFVWLTAQCYPFIIDDAFISFRYAANLAHGHGLVFNANRHDEEVAWSEHDLTVRKPNRQAAREDQEEVIGVVVVMPDELALHLHDHHVVSVELGNRARRPVLVEQHQLLREVDDLRRRR